jgi:UDP-glucose 4-epimerase
MRPQALVGQRVLVTGGLGFIGSTLALRLDEIGAQAVIIDAMVTRHGGNRANIEGLSQKARVIVADMRDRDAIRAAVSGVSIVFNLAGQVSHLDSMQDPQSDLAHNCGAQIELLEACREVSPDATVVFASTRQIYGRPLRLPVDEDHPLSPVDYNGVHKMAAEAYHELYYRAFGLRTVALRLTNTYGPRLRIADARQTFLGLWLRRTLEDGPIEVWGGEQLRDLTFVDDVVDAFLLAAVTPGAVGQRFNLGGEQIALMDLAVMLTRLAGRGSVERREFPPDRKRIDIGDYVADDRRFRQLTGWAPQVGLGEGLQRSLDYFRPRLSLYA